MGGRREKGQYYILQTCDQERFEARKVVFPGKCLIIFATGCSLSNARSLQENNAWSLQENSQSDCAHYCSHTSHACIINCNNNIFIEKFFFSYWH